jgi:HK97 family phage major capsid protein/HK97 family phage prohead protease
MKKKPQIEKTAERSITSDDLRIDGDQLELSISSEYPVRRFGGCTEVLVHDAKAIDLDRASGGAVPFLFNHDHNDCIGMVDKVWLDKKKLRANVHFFETDRAKDAKRMMSGGLKNVSIGYSVDDVQWDDERDDLYRVTRWGILELSLVTIPADPTVGFGRSKQKPNKTEESVMTDKASNIETEPEKVVEEVKVTGGEPVAATRTNYNQAEDGAKMEAKRKEAIQNLCKINKVDSRIERMWIEDGSSLDKVAQDLVKIMEERNRPEDHAGYIGLSAKEVRQYSLVRMIRAVSSHSTSAMQKAGLELAASEAVARKEGVTQRAGQSFFVPMDIMMQGLPQASKRAMLATQPSGNQIVSTDYLSNNFIELLRNESAVMRMGATRITGLQGNVTIPKQQGASTASWLANENAVVPDSDLTFGRLNLFPKNIAAIVEISHQMLQQSDPSIDALIMTDLAKTIALAADKAALSGDGANGSPTGITFTTNVGTQNIGAANSYADVIASQIPVLSANALYNNCAFIAGTTAVSKLITRSRFANTDTPLWEGSLLKGRMTGFDAYATNQFSNQAQFIFGWWESLILAEWGVLEIEYEKNLNFHSGLSGIRAWYTMDVGVRYPAAFNHGTVS